MRTDFSTLAGAPAAIENSGMSLVTTELAPMTERRPMVTPLVTTTLAPSHTLSPKVTGPFEVKPCHGTGLSRSSKRWLPSVTRQPLASMQCSPIVTCSMAAIMTFRFTSVPPPIEIRPVSDVSHTPGSK